MSDETISATADTRTDLVGLSRAELTEAMAAFGEKPFRARQLWHWIYHRGETDFAAMTTLAKPFRAKLTERFTVTHPQVSRDQASLDGTRKWLLRFADGNEAETVYIPEDEPPEYVCQVLQAHCTLVSLDPYGQVSDGYLSLSGLSFRVRLVYSNEDLKPTQVPPKYILHFQYTTFDLNEDVVKAYEVCAELTGKDYVAITDCQSAFALERPRVIRSRSSGTVVVLPSMLRINRPCGSVMDAIMGKGATMPA